MADESPWDVADQAVGAIAPEVAEFGNPDFAEFARALAAAVRGSVLHPAASFGATLRLVTRLAPLPAIAVGRWFGAELESHVDLDPKDRRFADPAWSDNPVFYSLRLMYEIAGHYGDELVDRSGVDALTREKAGVALGLLHDSLAPSNFHLTNPAVIKRAIDTAGKSVVDGAWNFVDDVLHNGGRPRQVDTSSFVLGKNLAATPSKVVYRNELMELLQYEPNTPKVHANPLLFSPPWINKYYVMDLAPGRSFVEWAVNHDRTVFAISYRNPGPSRPTSHSTTTSSTAPAGLDVVEDITGAQTIDVVGLCLGGAMTAITAAYLNAKGDSRVGALTLLNTLLDYSDPGVLRVFTDRRAVERLEKQMAQRLPAGRIDGDHFRPAAPERPDLQLRCVQLVDGAAATRIRHPGVECRQHPAAGGHAQLLPTQLLRREQSGEGPARACRRTDPARRHQAGHLSRRRRERPHRPVAVRLRRDPAAVRTGAVCSQQRWTHRRHRQPAGAEGLVPGSRRDTAVAERMAREGGPARRIVVGGLGWLVT